MFRIRVPLRKKDLLKDYFLDHYTKEYSRSHPILISGRKSLPLFPRRKSPKVIFYGRRTHHRVFPKADSDSPPARQLTCPAPP
jgi:hypothetical protein